MDSNLTNSEIEKDLRKRLGIGIPSSRSSQDVNRNTQQRTGCALRGDREQHFNRDVPDHARRRPDPMANLHRSPRGQHSWWDQQQQPAASGSSPRAQNFNRNSNYNSRSPKSWPNPSHDFDTPFGSSRDGYSAEHSGSNPHRLRSTVQGRTKDSPREGKSVLNVDCVDSGGGNDNDVIEEAVGEQDEDRLSANKKGTKRRLRKKKKDKKGSSGIEESFNKLEVVEVDNKPSPAMQIAAAIEDQMKQKDTLTLAESVDKEKFSDSRTSAGIQVASSSLVKKAINATTKQANKTPLPKSELNFTSRETWPELGSEVSVKTNKTALKPRAENEVAGAESKHKPAASDILDENRPPPEVLERLAKEYIHPLRKRHSKFPKAMFFCRLCEYHCDTVPICNRHLKESRHLKNKSVRELEITLRNLPAPTDSHTQALTELLVTLHKKFALTDDDQQTRQQCVKYLNAKVHKKLPCCELRLYGSSLTGIGMKEADVNIDLVVSDKENPAIILMTVFDVLKAEAGLTDVQSDFGAKIPAIHFLEKKSGLKCVVSLNNLTSYKTTCLLAEYAKIDPRVRILGVVFRHWAKLCLIDRQKMGTLPSYSYILMLVYFLQQHSPPVLPVLHEMAKKPEDEYLRSEEACKLWQTMNKESIGTLWVELFKFYSVTYKMPDFVISLRQWKPVTRSEKNWSTKKIALEDPYSPKRNLARFISNQVLFDYILDRFKMTYKYFGIPQTTKGPLFSKLLGMDQGNDVFTDKKDFEGSGKKFLEVLDNIAKRTRELKLSQQKDGNNTKDDDDDDDVLILSVSELKKMKKIGIKPSGSTSDSTNPSVNSVIADMATLDNVSVMAASKEASKNAKNGKNLATKQDIGDNRELAEKGSCSLSCEHENLAPKDYIPSSHLLGLIQDEGDSEDFSETSPPGADDDSEQENCIPLSLMEALDDDLDVNSLSGADGSDNPLMTNHNIILNGDLAEDIHSLEESENHVDLKNGEEFIVETKELCEKSEELRPHSLSTNTEAVMFKSHVLNTDVKTRGPETTESDLDLSNSSKDHGSSPKPKRVKTPKLPEDLLVQINSLQKKDFSFQFNEVDFTGGKKPSVFCSVCQKEGHLKQECPEEKLPELLPLPHMERKFMMAIVQACYEIYADNCPRDYETAERLEILNDLQNFIQHHLYPDARLELFGSSCNGFGFAHSDLDICLTFANNKTGEDLKCVPIIESLTEKLKKHKILYNVIPITTAKVPIVKFTHRPSRLEGDISLYNTLAQHNTRMLFLYSELDRRVKILGYTMKFFAKCCDIGDASRGSLSSYAYILMVIYFLQQRCPPVIPVLQELYDKSKTAPTRTVDGWNAWFLDDPKKVQQMWPYFGKNQESVGELWLGLLRFYTEEFNFQDSVISIRQHKILTRFEKLWNSKCIAIEDPFDLQHNLGAGVSRKMNSYIMKAFIKGRYLFGSPIRIIPYRYRTLKEYLFCPAELTDGAPPNDRGCRLCGKIGHMIKDCPRKRPHNRDRENAGKDQNKEQFRENAQAQPSDPHRGQTKETNREQSRDNQRPSREKKSEPFFIEKVMIPQTNQGFSLPNSLQFNNSMSVSPSSRKVLLPQPMVNVSFNRNGPQLRPGLNMGQFAPNLLMTQQQPNQLTGMRLTCAQPIPVHNTRQDEATSINSTKASNSLPNMPLQYTITPLLTQPTSKMVSAPLDEASSSSKDDNNSSVKGSMQHHALPESCANSKESPSPIQYSKVTTQVSSTLNNNEKVVEQQTRPTGRLNQPKLSSSTRSRNVIVAQSLNKLSNTSPSLSHSNAKVSNSTTHVNTSEKLLTGKNDVALNESLGPKKPALSTSEHACPVTAPLETTKDRSLKGTAQPAVFSELMKDRPTMGAPTTVFTIETMKDHSSEIQLSEKVRLMNAQNLRTSAISDSPNLQMSSQPTADHVPTSFALSLPLGQHPPSFSAPPGFMNVPYRMQFSQRQFSTEGSTSFTGLHDPHIQHGRGRQPPPPPPGIPVAPSYSPVFINPGDTGGNGIPRQQNPVQQFPNSIHSPLPQTSQQFTQYPGLFHPYPAQYFQMGLPAYPVSAFGQMASQQQHPQSQQRMQNATSGQPSPAPSPQLTAQERSAHMPLTIRTNAEAVPFLTTAQTNPVVTHESSPVPGLQIPASHERPSENILLNAMGLSRPNSNLTHDSQWMQLNVAGNANSTGRSDPACATGGSRSVHLHQGAQIVFKGNESD